MQAPIERPYIGAAVIVPRTFHLEFTCDSRPYCWTGAALSASDAENKARRALYMDAEGFFNSRARMIACGVVA